MKLQVYSWAGITSSPSEQSITPLSGSLSGGQVTTQTS